MSGSTLMRQAMHNSKSLSLVALLAATSCGKATQPKPQCKAQQEEYAAKYIPDGFDPAAPPDGCTADDILPGEVLNLQYYRADLNGAPKLAIEPASIAEAIAAGEEHKVDVKPEPEFSIGAFKDVFPDDHDICEAPKLDATSLHVDAIPPEDPMKPETAVAAVDLTYKWANVKVLTKPLSNAVHFGADLERTTGTCTLKYKVSAVYPVIFCGDKEKPVLDENGMPTDEMEPDFENSKPLDPKEACAPSEAGQSEGSGLPDLKYDCPEKLLLCVPAVKFPATN
jgi:hypothetical protein